jgi:hypothetical protein
LLKIKKEFGFSCNRFLRSAGGAAFVIRVRWWFYWNPLTVWSELDGSLNSQLANWVPYELPCVLSPDSVIAHIPCDGLPDV